MLETWTRNNFKFCKYNKNFPKSLNLIKAGATQNELSLVSRLKKQFNLKINLKNQDLN